MKNLKTTFTMTFVILSFSALAQFWSAKEKPHIIPQPVSYENGRSSFKINARAGIQISPSSKELGKMADIINERLGWFGIPQLKTTINHNNTPAKNTIWLSVGEYGDEIGKEGYLLEINRKYISVKANTATGVFYGIQSLIQLLPEAPEKQSILKSGSIKVASCNITDYPRFPYRGLHLDVGRHLFPVEFIKKYIDIMSMYKINNFHWHLTEDQGWRLEIMKYPLLTETGAYRKSTATGRNSGQDNMFYGGYYTQDEAREIVAYALARQVNIIPEIEMPGHALAALASYPHLGCTGGPYEVETTWGVFEDIYCGGNDEVFTFLQDVLLEVMDIFPSKYIHIGGDEAPKTRWDVCNKCQKRIKDENLKDSQELQSYFITRLEKFLNKHGRQIIGWDEILEGGLAPGATVMSWRGTEGGIAAARLGHDVIMTPGSHCYLDYYQGDPASEPFGIGGYNTLKNTYGFEPIPAELTEKEGNHILGAQGNVWTEYIKTSDLVEYMAYPRAIALAEVNWSPKEYRNWDDFIRRLTKHLPILDKNNLNYSKSTFGVNFSVIRNEKDKQLQIELVSDITGAAIKYYTELNNQTSTVMNYTGPFKPEKSKTIFAYVDNAGKEPLKISKKEIIVHDAFGIIPILNTLYDHRYAANGASSLTDGLRANAHSLRKEWIGYLGNDADIILDLGISKDINTLSLGFLHNPGSWIFLPVDVEVSFSNDGINYLPAAGMKPDFITPTDPKGILYTIIDLRARARYIHIIAKNRATCPVGHSGEGEKAWLFMDEIMVNYPRD
ncbi:MAG: beta-N-acetylhexosaminidase [Lentimicrobium sp.]|nr:beta-N-acetylhexosaminidase [Lentimicrobium sp.]